MSKQRRQENLWFLPYYQTCQLVQDMFLYLETGEMKQYGENLYLDLEGDAVYTFKKDKFEIYGSYKKQQPNKQEEIWVIFNLQGEEKFHYYPVLTWVIRIKDVFEEYKEITKIEKALIKPPAIDSKLKKKIKKQEKRHQTLKKQKRELLLEKMRLNQIIRNMDLDHLDIY